MNCQFYASWTSKLLLREIFFKKSLVEKLARFEREQKIILGSSVSHMDRVWLQSYIENVCVKFRNTALTRQNHKLENLGLNYNLHVDPGLVILNVSNRVLNTDERRVLSLGLDFKIPVFKLDFCKYFLYFEKIIHAFNSFTKFKTVGNFTEDIKFIANRYFYKFKGFKTFCPVFSFADLKVLRALKADDSIVICKPDKGRGVVIMNKTDYVSKLKTVLSDVSKFKILDVDVFKCILRIEDKINNCLRSFKKRNLLTEYYQSLFCSGTVPGRLYGLPKVHKNKNKNNIPCRPILSAINTPSYKLAKFFVPILDSLTRNIYSIRDSFQFADFLSTLSLEDCYMASFDVESLFTNLPVRETCDIICNQLFLDRNTMLDLTKVDFSKLLNLAVSDSVFLFDDILYQQIEGMAMGSPLGPTFANSFLCFHEQSWLSDCPLEFKPLVYKRYVDDCFIIFKRPEHSSLFLNYLNSRHPNIKFTSESQINNAISFLDLTITHKDKIFHTSLYRKPTNTKLGTNFFSSIPLKFKLSSIKCRISRAYKLCSNWTSFHSEVEYIKSFANFNLFPSAMVDRLVFSFLDRLFKPTFPIIDVPRANMYIKLPYLGSITDALNGDLSLTLGKFFPQCKPIFINTNSSSIGTYFNCKPRLPLLVESSLVYLYTCADCQNCYVGQTGLQLQVRISKHKGCSFRTGRPLSNPEVSSIRQHSEANSHSIASDSFSILSRSSWDLDRKILESLFIKKLSPTLNGDDSSIKLYTQ